MSTRPTWHFDGRVVVVTGAVRGLGAQIVRAFARAGARVAALDRDADAVEHAATGPRGEAPALSLHVDVTDHDAVDRALDRVVATLGAPDVLVANAGIGIRGPALEWAPRGLRVNAVAPNYVDTPLTEAIFSDPAKLAQVMAHTPMGRLPTPDDVAQAVLFLASDAAASITGHVLAVDGGYLAR
jgi:NAD(P)-dependent dehydrogenase (short-subunit alcohol dehydrogenase family)